MVGLGGTELLDWGRYVENNGFVCPLTLVATGVVIQSPR